MEDADELFDLSSAARCHLFISASLPLLTPRSEQHRRDATVKLDGHARDSLAFKVRRSMPSTSIQFQMYGSRGNQ